MRWVAEGGLLFRSAGVSAEDHPQQVGETGCTERENRGSIIHRAGVGEDGGVDTLGGFEREIGFDDAPGNVLACDRGDGLYRLSEPDLAQQFGQHELKRGTMEPAKTTQCGPFGKIVRAQITEIAICPQATIDLLGICQAGGVSVGKDGQEHRRPMGFAAEAKVALSFRPIHSLGCV